ncbi:unnamed protein product [Cunninghamella blakesleeana]
MNHSNILVDDNTSHYSNSSGSNNGYEESLSGFIKLEQVEEDHIQGGNKKVRKIIVILENASLEAARANPSRSDNIADARPDIVHQCLLTLLDSPLNKAGHLEVYIHTAKGVVIRVNPTCRIPRTIKRFSGLMIQLLERGFIAGSSDGGQRLLEIIQPPLAQYLPKKSIRLALSWNAERVKLYPYFKELDLDNEPLVIAVGAMAKGEDTFADDYINQKIGISKYSLSAAVACSKVCCALEDLWDIL